MSMRKEIILGEIAGKNNAIHAYDKLIWTVRSGYLSLLFGAWAIVIKAVVDKSGNFPGKGHLLLALFVVSLGFTIGAFVLDQMYVKRKFRVITALNKLLAKAMEIADCETIEPEINKELREVLSIAGDTDDRTYLTAGYQKAVYLEFALYPICLLTVSIAGLLCVL